MRNNTLGDSWGMAPDEKNVFHNFSEDGRSIFKNPDGSCANTKYVHRNGRYEVIIDGSNNIVTLPSSTETFNYYPPPQEVAHMDYEVDPWIGFGSSNGDNTIYNLRKIMLIGI